MHKPLFLAAAIAATFVGSTISTGLSTAAYAKGPATDCPHIFGTNGKPSVASSAPATRTQFLCFRGYAVQTSATTRTALWSAENLTAQAVLAARSVPRDSDFYEEAEIPAADRARLSDYGRGTGLDRGHLAPSGDFPDLASQAESFSLANIVPQAAARNDATPRYAVVSVAELASFAGVDPFPRLEKSYRDTPMALLAPAPHRARSRAARSALPR